MEQTRHALDYLKVVRRRKWWLIVPIIGGLAIGAALVQFLPREYRAMATLGVSAPSVSPTLVNQNILLDNPDRLRALTHELLSDTVLSRVVADEGLGTGAAAVPHIHSVRSAVKLSVPDPVSRTVDDMRRLDAFHVTYTDSDPARAQSITNRIASVFIDETSKARTNSAERSSEYLQAERDRAQTRLTELERRLRQAKEAYIGRLPEQTQANLQTLGGLRQQLEINGTSLRHQQERLSMIQRQIQMLEQDAAKGLTGSPASGATAPDRVTTLEEQLAAARGMYTEKHPEVQRLEAELKTALQEVVTPPTRPAVDRKARLQVDPMYRQLLADRDATTLSVRELEHSGAALRGQIGDYQGRVEVAPMVEQQLASVQREYDLAQRHYADVSEKFANATMAESVARNRHGEQFAIIYPATLPTKPASPVPERVMLIALLGGICLGAALALAREYLDPSVHSSRDLADDLELPVLGEVAHVPATSR